VLFHGRPDGSIAICPISSEAATTQRVRYGPDQLGLLLTVGLVAYFKVGTSKTIAHLLC
jgi:hypothetical protein